MKKLHYTNLYDEYESIKGAPTPIEDYSYNVNRSTHSYKQYFQNRLDKKRK